ncbi:MAG: alpha-glucosidase C-terminal domain-containing protein [Saprospiraceae bacterium]|nr:alpha-glucosidase C-terminal domain-containing protein [Saprospiraceae bacterium]
MKNIIAFFLFIIVAFVGNAQVYVNNTSPSLEDELTLTFKADEGNAGLKDYSGDIYAHTGLITRSSTHAGDWKSVVAEWGINKPQLKLLKTGDNTYQLKFNLKNLYGVQDASDVIALALVLRSADGSKVGKAVGDNDIFYFFKENPFKTTPEVHKMSTTPSPEWAKQGIIYEVNIRQYTKEGTLKAFQAHLSRLKDLGVNILWLMPIQPIGLEKRKGTLGSYYSIKNYTEVNPEFGTKEDLKKVVDLAHGMGMKVILDWVANHTSWDNEWLKMHPNWYSKNDKNEIISPYDWTDVAKLNYDQYYMREAMIDAMKYWINEADIDGFRCDVAGEVPSDFWENARMELEKVKPIWMVAENQDQLYLLNAAFNANYDWVTHHLMNNIAQEKLPASKITDNVLEQLNKYPQGSYTMNFISNHDENTWHGSEFERLGDALKPFAALCYTLPGIPLMYSGQEASLKKSLSFFDKDVINWDDTSLVGFYTGLNNLKKLNKALWNGTAGGNFEVIHNSNESKVISFCRKTDNNKVLVVANVSKTPCDVDLELGANQGIYSDWYKKDLYTFHKKSKVSLAAYEFKIFIFEREAPKEKRRVEHYMLENNKLLLVTNDGKITITPYFNHTVEVTFAKDGETNPKSESIIATSSTDKCELKEENGAIIYALGDLKVNIKKDPLQISYSYKGQNLISEEKGFEENKSDGTEGFSFSLDKNEKLTGGGERALGMNRRGTRLKLYNKPSYGYEEKADLMYYSLPIVISSKKYMLIFDNGASGYLDLGKTSKDILAFGAEGGRMSYYIVASDDWTNLTKNFAQVTGTQPLPPRWMFGNIASRMGYHSQREVENVVNTYRKDNIPLDAVVLDLYWFGKDLKGTLGNLEWYTDSFPQPELMLKDFKKKGVNTILITEPFFIEGTKKFQEVKDFGLLGKNAHGDPYMFDFYFGHTGLIDIFNPNAQNWFWNVYKKHTYTGVDGWWGDLGEPEVHPDDMYHWTGKANLLHNTYGHEWAKTIAHGYEVDFPTKRPVILMRSGFVGSQRYGLVPWSGDVNRTWGGLKPQVEISLTMGMQGLAYMHSDLGGFAGDYKDSELYLRWLQYGVFQPVYRTHAQQEVPSEPIFWDDVTKNAARKLINQRYQLLPYIYTLAWENSQTGVPLMRPLYYLEDKSEHFDNSESYLWGDCFLVSPITSKGQKEKNVYLPKNSQWFDYVSDRTYDGGNSYNITLTDDAIPVFVKGGSFVPTIDVIQSTASYDTLSKLYVHYYYDKTITSSTGEFYDDDGITSNNYQKDNYDLFNFTANVSDKKLVLKTSEHKGMTFSTKKKELEFVVHGLPAAPKDIFINDSKLGRQQYTQFKWNAKERILVVTLEKLSSMNLMHEIEINF